MSLATQVAALSNRQLAILALILGGCIGLVTLASPLLPALFIIGAVFATGALYRPVYMVPVVFTSILLEAAGEMEATLAGLPITLSKLAVVAAIGIWVVRASLNRQSLIERLPITWGMMAVVGSMIIGIGVAGATGVMQVSTTFSVIMVCTLTHLIAQLLPIARIIWLQRIIILLIVVVLFAQLTNAPVESVLDDRYTGAFLDPNMWSMTLLLIIPPCLALLAEEKNRGWVVVLALLTVLFPLNIFQSLSRAGLLASILVTPGLIWLIWNRRWTFGLTLVAIPFLIGFFVSPEALSARYESLIDPTLTEADGSLQQRAELARTATLLFKENLLLGVGQGRFIEESIARTNGATNLIAHNTYLTIAAELGLYGIAAHAFLAFLIIRQGVRAVWRAPTRKLQRLVGGYVIALISFAAMSATLNTMAFSMAYFVLGVFMVLDRATHLSVEELIPINLGDESDLKSE